MMKKYFVLRNVFTCALAALLFAACGTDRSFVAISFNGMTNDTVMVRRVNIDNMLSVVKDTLVANNSMIVYEVPSDSAYLVTFAPAQLDRVPDDWPDAISASVVEVLVGPRDKVSVSAELYDDYVAYSSPDEGFNKDFAEHRLTYREQAVQINARTFMCHQMQMQGGGGSGGYGRGEQTISRHTRVYERCCTP